MNFKKIATALLATLFSGSLAAAPVVTVNGATIDSSEIDHRVRIIQNQTQGQISDSPELRMRLTNDLIVETLIAQEARRLKLDQSSEYKQAENDLRQQAKAQGADKLPTFNQDWKNAQNRLLMIAFAEDVLKKNPITEQEIQNQYNAIKNRYNATDEIQLGQIVTNKPEHAQAAIRELSQKKKFTDVASKYTIDPEGKAAGGIFSEFMALVDLKENNPPIYEAVSKLTKGGYTSKAISDNGIHFVFYINDKRKITVPPLSELQESIRTSLADERIDAQIEQLGNKANIQPAK